MRFYGNFGKSNSIGEKHRYSTVLQRYCQEVTIRGRVVQKKFRQVDMEILYVAGSSLDTRGKRVLVREGVVENVIYPEDGVDDVDIKLLGISVKDKRYIERFFAGGSK